MLDGRVAPRVKHKTGKNVIVFHSPLLFHNNNKITFQ